MFTYVYMFVCICMYMYVYLYIYVCMCICMYVYKYIFVCVWMNFHFHLHMLPIPICIYLYFPRCFLIFSTPFPHAPAHAPRYHYANFIGGIMLISTANFREMNGLSNNFWGWGRVRYEGSLTTHLTYRVICNDPQCLLSLSLSRKMMSCTSA